MAKPLKRVLLAGAPATGKSSVARSLQSSLGVCEYRNLDLEVHALCDERRHSGPLSDEMIDESVRRLMSKPAHPGSLVVELPHHDYVTLLRSGVLDPSQYDCIVVITAPYQLLRDREHSRRHSVPLHYIARCVGAVEALCVWLDEIRSHYLRFDSRLIAPREMSECIIDFVRRHESETLSRLAIGPQPSRPYLGGHLLSGVEWDDDLVSEILRRFKVRSVLDIGCGTGLTLDLFRQRGIEAWGLEGNPAVLDGPATNRQRLLLVDFTKQWIEWPVKVDLTWCVEVLEHIPVQHEKNVLLTIARNTLQLAFVTAARPGQPGYHHVNCQPKSYWIQSLQEFGLRYLDSTPELLSRLSGNGPFGTNTLKDNGMFFEVQA